MKKLYTPENMRKTDKWLIETAGIPGITLMETAADGVVKAVERHAAAVPVSCAVIYIGPGNNGGDGLAVLRKLHNKGINAKGVLLCNPDSFRGDAKAELEAAAAAGCPFISEEEAAHLLRTDVVAVDAVFGTGLSRAPEGKIAEAIQKINMSNAYVISVDIPSGVSGETGAVFGIAVRADETVTFQYLKPGLVLTAGRKLAGSVTVHPLSDEQSPIETDQFLLEENDVRNLLPPRPMDAHKGSSGSALLLIGSERYTGAALLAASACLRGGAGLTTVGVPAGVKPAFSSLPEAMCVPLGDGGEWNEKACGEATRLIAGKTAVAMGSGMGAIERPDLIESVLKSGLPTVLDADALNCMSKNRALFGFLHEGAVMTPHPGEMARLTGKTVQEITSDPVRCAKKAAAEWHATVLLKGATTCISDGEKVFLNTSGNAGMAKGGSGDALTGLILAFLSQGLKPFDAACAGAYILGASADRAMDMLSHRALLAGDFIGMIKSTVGRRL